MSKSLKIFLVIAASLAFGYLPGAARAEVCTASTALDFVAKDPAGSFIPNARVEVYSQAVDADGAIRPATKLAAATASATLGSAHLVWKGQTADNYAIKVQTVSKDNASFWYFNQPIGCGETASLTKTLSGILFIMHDPAGNLLTNTSFSVYSQLYDASGQPLKQVKELLATANTGTSGQTKIYLPQGSVVSRDKALSDHYTLEITRSGRKFDKYNIEVKDGQLTTVSYYVSGLRVKLQDASGALFPSGSKVDVFKQDVDQDNIRQKGAAAGSFTLSDDGYGNFELPVGLYVLGVKDKNGSYQYFWDVEVVEGQTNQHTLVSEQGAQPVTTACQNSSEFTLTLRNFAGEFIPGLKYELYEQNTDADGLPIAGKKVGGATIAVSGKGSFSFKPDPRQLYAVKVWDKRSDLGEFWFYSAVRFVCDYDRALTESLPALKIVLRDNEGNLRRNYSFSLYAQEYDADNHPFFQAKDLIGTYTTDGGGVAVTYVSPFNTYRRGLTGDYAISAKDASGNVSNFYNIRIPADRDYEFESVFSGFSGELTDARSRILGNREVRLYEKKTGSLGKLLLKAKTDANGLFRFEYPSGTYTLVALDDFGQENNFGDVILKGGTNYKKLVMSAVSFNLTNSQTPLENNVSLSLYSLLAGDKGNYYRDKLIQTIKLSAGKSETFALAAGPYLAVYSSVGNQEFGAPFLVKNGAIQSVTLTTSSQSRLSAGQGFRVPGAAAVPAAGESTGPARPASSLLARIKGRILLQVEDKGQAWYINPIDGKKYYLGRPADAFAAMRALGLGISNGDFASLGKNPSAWKRLAGRILLKTEDKGQAYYFDPTNLELYYLGRPSDAFNAMRSRGLGAKNADLDQIPTGTN